MNEEDDEWRARRLEKYAAKQKGRGSEIGFRHLFSNLLNTPPWISKIEDAGLEDDWKKGIDFWMYTTTGWRIPIQIKSSFKGLEKHVLFHGYKICIVIMHEDLDVDSMREKAIYYIQKWQEEMIRRGIDNRFKI